MFDLFDVVRITKALPEHGIEAGAVGAVVLVFDGPVPRYEVEVVAADGRARYQGTFAPEDLEPG